MFLDIFNPVFSKNPFFIGLSLTPLFPPDGTGDLLGEVGVSG